MKHVMTVRNLIFLSALTAIILVLTLITAGSVARQPQLGEVAPFLILTGLAWYLILLITNRKEIIAGLSAIFRSRREGDMARGYSWSTIATYASILAVAVVLLWLGVPNRVLNGLQGLILVSGAGGASSALPSNRLIGFLPASAFISFAVILVAAIFTVSFVMIVVAARVGFNSQQVHLSESELEVEQDTAEIVHQTITSLKQDNERDYHEIILECYRKMCAVLQKAGVEVASTETAREFAKTVSIKLKVGQEAIAGLTFLFEEARYSRHEISEDKRIVALNYLESLQKTLSPNVGMAA